VPKLPLVCLDANSFIDLFLDRPRAGKLAEVLQEINGRLAVSTLTVSICSYLMQKADAQGSLLLLRDFAQDFQVLGVTDTTLTKAFRMVQDSDLEDALQVACALENGVGIFITADKKLAERYDSFIKIRLIAS